MKAHIHAAEMAQYAEDALQTDRPWERWECLESYPPGTRYPLWQNCALNPSWNLTTMFRRKTPRPEKTIVKCYYNKISGSISWAATDWDYPHLIHQPQHDLIVEVPT